MTGDNDNINEKIDPPSVDSDQDAGTPNEISKPVNSKKGGKKLKSVLRPIKNSKPRNKTNTNAPEKPNQIKQETPREAAQEVDTSEHVETQRLSNTLDRSNEISIESNQRTFNNIEEYQSPFTGVLEKRQRAVSTVHAEEIKLRERLAKAEVKETKLGKEILKSYAQIYGYTDYGQLSFDLPKLKTGELKGGKPLVNSKEEYEQLALAIPELEKEEQITRAKATSILKDIGSLQSRKEVTAAKAFEYGIRRELADIPTRTNVLSREEDISSIAAIEVADKPFRDYRRQRKQQQNEQELLKEDLLTASQDTETPEGVEKFKEISKTLEQKTRETAKSLALERAQKRSGKDIESLFERSTETIDRTQGRLETEKIREDIKQGKTGSLEKELENLKNATVALIDAQKRFKEEMSSATGATEETRKKLNELTEAAEKQEKKVREIERVGGGGGGDRLGTGFQTAGNVGVAVADAARFAFVTSDIQQKQARAGVADIVNQEYFDYRSAAQGDMAALRRVSGMYRRQEKEASELKLREIGVTSEEVVAASAGVAGDVMEAQAGAALPWDKVAKGAPTLIRGAAQVSKIGVDLAKGITPANTFIQGFQAGKNLEDATNRIADYHRQELFDYGRNTYGTLQGFGAEADKTFKSFSTGESLSKFADFGLDPTKTLQLVGQAATSMGGAFTNVSEGRQQEVTQRAAQLDQARVMSAQQYLGNMGQLTQVGGGSKQMEEIMANAVARGVGNAKNIGEIVSLVTGISAKTGSSTAAGVTALVGKTMANLGAVMPGPENEALRRATTESLMDRTNQMIGGTGMDFASTLGMAKINTQFAGASTPTRLVLKRDLNMGVIAEMEKRLQDKTPEGEKAFKQYVQSVGMGEIFYNKEGKYVGPEGAKGTVGKLKGIAVDQVLATSLGFTPKETQEKLRKHLLGDKQKLTEAEEAQLGGLTKLIYGTSGAFEGTKGTFGDITDVPIGKVPTSPETGPTRDQAKISQEQAKVQVKGLGTGVATEGATSVVDALSTLTKDFTKAMQEFKPAELQQKAVEASIQMTTDFQNVVNKDFKSAITELKQAAELLKGASGVRDFVNNANNQKNKKEVEKTREERPNPSPNFSTWQSK